MLVSAAAFLAVAAARAEEPAVDLATAPAPQTFDLAISRDTLWTPSTQTGLNLTVDHPFGDPRLRLVIAPSILRETGERFFGIGDAWVAPAAVIPDMPDASRIHPTLAARLRVDLGDNFYLGLGSSYTHAWFDPLPGMMVPPNAIEHSLLLGSTTLAYDTRDSESAPTRGAYQGITLRASPAAGSPYHYEELDLQSRWYLPLDGRRLRLAARVGADVQAGDLPPFELGRLDDTLAPGGALAVRGVPFRQAAREKLYANLELHRRLTSFTRHGETWALDAVAFVDAGEVFAAWKPDAMDEGVKLGAGAGLRLVRGDFVMRADVAWSPDARPVGACLAAGEMF
jgi:hypothetical protein